MRQLLFSNEVTLEDEKVMRLDYSLTENLSKEDPHYPYYGIRITKYLDSVTESDEIAGVSTSKDEVTSILKKLCLLEVTQFQWQRWWTSLFHEKLYPPRTE